MKKLLVLSLTALICATAFVGCGKKNDKEGDKLNLKDFGGAEIIVATSSEDLFADKADESNYFAAISERTKAIESELNCKVKMVTANHNALYDQAFTTIMSGSKFADVIAPSLWKLTSYMSSGLIADLNKVPELDLKGDGWYKQFSDFATIKGKTYFAVCGATNPTWVTNCVFYNKRIVKENSLDDPMTLYKDKKWTVSKMREMARTATKELDGKAGMTKDDQWGISIVDKYGAGGIYILTANNTKMLDLDANGNLVYNMTNPKLIESINLANDIYNKDKTTFSNVDGQAPKDVLKLFTSGKALFMPSVYDNAQRISNMKDDYGMVPFPKGDAVDEYYANLDWNGVVLSVPSNLNESDMKRAGTFLNVLAKHSKNEVEVWSAEQKARNLRDDDSRAVFDTLAKIGKYDYSQYCASVSNMNLYSATWEVVYQSLCEQYDPVVEIEKKKEIGITALKDFMDKLEKE